MRRYKGIREVLRTLAVFLAACMILCLVRQFLVVQYSISSPRPAVPLKQGDRIVVFRTSYGVRLPFPEIFQCRRLGSKMPGRGDLMAFNLPTDTSRQIPSRMVCVAQCLALPRDTVWLTRDLKVSTRQGRETFPFVVPARGTRVKVTKWNARLLCNTINFHEPCHCAEMIGDTLMIDGHTARDVMFTQDYFWVYSGAQSNVDDSRSYGLVPKSHLVGKVGFVVYSVIDGAPFYRCLRPDRFFVNPVKANK